MQRRYVIRACHSFTSFWADGMAELIETVSRIERENDEPYESFSRGEGVLHLLAGESARTMRLLCGAPLQDASWTLNPNNAFCDDCRRILDAR
jgi:hypothetical protein